MSSSRRRDRDETDDDSPSRVVRPRYPIFSDDPYLGGRTSRVTEPTDDSDSNEEPFEDEEDPRPTRLRSPSPLPSTVPPPSAIPPSPVFPSFQFATIQQEGTLRWDWMPGILDWWRRAENIPVLPEVPGPPTPIPSLTQEPVHHTMPIVVTRLLTHDYQLNRLERVVRIDASTNAVELIQQQVVGVETDMTELRDDVVTTHTIGVQNRDEIAELRQLVDTCLHRIADLEQEVSTLRGDRDQMRTVSGQSTRMVALLEGMMDRLDSQNL